MNKTKPKQGKAIWLSAFPKQAIRTPAKKPPGQKQRKRINAITPELAKQKVIYRRRVKEILNEVYRVGGAGQFCEVARVIFGELVQVNQVHHRFGRRGKLLLYEPYWMLVSEIGHDWIHKHPEKARERGWLCPLGFFNTVPKDL